MIQSEELSLAEWLEQTEKIRADLYEYGKTRLPKDVSERHHDLDRSIQSADDAGRLVSEADSFLTQERARAILKVKLDHPKLSADERKVMVEDSVRGLQLLRDALAVTQRTIRDRIYTNQNENRAGR